MNDLLLRLRKWALIKLAAGHPVAMNLKLTRGLYIQAEPLTGLYENIHIDYALEYPAGPDKIGIYFSARKPG